MMHTTNYFSTLIMPSPDCLAAKGLVPTKPGTVAALQHQMLADTPFAMTSDDLLWAVDCVRKGRDPADRDMRAGFFAKPMACLRASPLVKTYGWALHHDADGRVALVDPGSSAFAVLLEDADLTRLAGMRSARA